MLTGVGTSGWFAGVRPRGTRRVRTVPERRDPAEEEPMGARVRTPQLLVTGGAAVAALALVVGAAPSSAAPTAPGAAGAAKAAGVVWGSCEPGTTDEVLEANYGMKCGSLEVPLDHSKPDGAKISIAVSRIEHTDDANYQGIIVLNPGGPGGSGTVMPIISLFVDPAVAAQYDWIGFDPRGVGNSSPALSCDNDYAVPVRPPYDPTRDWIEKAWLKRVKGYAKDCGAAASPEFLKHLRTIDSADDMDSIRQAFGADKMNYYGYSYGTYLGQVYAARYPERVRRMILDSNVDPRYVWEQGNLDQNVAFETTMSKFWTWVAKYDSVYHLGRTPAKVEHRYYRTQRELKGSPAGGQIGPAEFNDVILNAGYAEFLWPDVAAAWSAWVNDKDPSGLIGFYGDGVGDNSYAMYLGVQCVDAKWSRNWNTWMKENSRTAKKAPFVTWGNMWYNAPCAFWPVKASTPQKVGDKAGKLPPILLLDEQFDGPTPISGSFEVRKRFPSAVLIETLGGASHAISPSGNPCPDDRINAYLADGTVPARKPGNKRADVYCQALPQPVPATPGPTAASFKAASSRAALADRLKADFRRQMAALQH